MMGILIKQLINITDAIFLGHVGEIELGVSALAGIWYLPLCCTFICTDLKKSTCIGDFTLSPYSYIRSLK